MDFEIRLIETVGKRMSLDYFASKVARYSKGLSQIMSMSFRRLGVSQSQMDLNLGDILLAVAVAQ